VIHLKSLQSFIIVLLSVFLLLPGQVMGTVLCIRADGHIALEIAQNGRCGTLSTPVPPHEHHEHHKHIAQTLPSTDHCGPCIDVSLSTNNIDDQPLLSAPSSLPKLEAPVLALVTFVVSVSIKSPQTYFVLPPLPLASTLIAFRTVVLLL
jgi:hypothetical protein